MKGLRILVLTAITSAMLAYGVAAAGVAGLIGVSYELLPGSSFQEGCIPPCMCPVMMSDDLVGTFTLVKKSMSSQDAFYRIKEISWKAIGPNGEVVHTITGTGNYRYRNVGNAYVKHQLILNVSIDGGKLIQLDSGNIISCSQFPVIATSIRRGTQCFDIWMDVIAEPSS